MKQLLSVSCVVTQLRAKKMQVKLYLKDSLSIVVQLFERQSSY